MKKWQINFIRLITLPLSFFLSEKDFGHELQRNMISTIFRQVVENGTLLITESNDWLVCLLFKLKEPNSFVFEH